MVALLLSLFAFALLHKIFKALHVTCKHVVDRRISHRLVLTFFVALGVENTFEVEFEVLNLNREVFYSKLSLTTLSGQLTVCDVNLFCDLLLCVREDLIIKGQGVNISSDGLGYLSFLIAERFHKVT